MAMNENDDIKKKVDESWKETVRKESASSGEEIQMPPEASFALFITSLMMQGLVALGEIENPVTKKKGTSPLQAKFVIDTVAMLKEKTKANLTSEEEEMLDSILYELRMRFIRVTGKGGSGG